MIILVVYDVRNNFLDNYEGMWKGKKIISQVCLTFIFTIFFFSLIFSFINPQY